MESDCGFAEGDVVMEENLLLVAVERQHPERFLSAVHLVFPSEVEFDGEVHSQAALGDWLHVGIQFDSGDAMDEFVQDSTQFGKFGQVSDLLRRHLVERLPTELLLLFQSAQHVLRDLLELPQWVHAAPH